MKCSCIGLGAVLACLMACGGTGTPGAEPDQDLPMESVAPTPQAQRSYFVNSIVTGVTGNNPILTLDGNAPELRHVDGDEAHALVQSALEALHQKGISITKIFVTKLKLKSLPAMIADFRDSLVHLDASENQLMDLPERFQEINGLIHLDLHGNKLKTIPPQVAASAKTLKQLHLYNNEIDNVGTACKETACMEQCNLGGNKLTCIPYGDINLNDMMSKPGGWLNLNDNQLKSLDERFLGELRKIKTIELQVNPWVKPENNTDNRYTIVFLDDTRGGSNVAFHKPPQPAAQ